MHQLVNASWSASFGPPHTDLATKELTSIPARGLEQPRRLGLLELAPALKLRSVLLGVLLNILNITLVSSLKIFLYNAPGSH